MSQHRFKSKTSAGQEVDVLAGWDRPLQGYFLLVKPVPDPGHYLFCNLDVPDDVPSHPQTWDFFQAKLEEFGIPMPKGLLQHLQADKANNAGNLTVRWP